MPEGRMYRGYYIRLKPEGGWGVYSTNNYLVVTQASEEGCVEWIDYAKKMSQQRRDRKKAEVRGRW